MYHFIKKTEDVLSFQFHADNIMLIKGKPNEAHLTIVNDDMEVKCKMNFVTAYDFVVYHEKIYITESKTYNSYLLKFEDNRLEIVEKLNYTFNIEGWCFKNKTIKNLHLTSGYIDKVNYFLLIDLATGKLLNNMPMELGFGIEEFLISSDKLISVNSNSLGLFTLDNKKIWEYNINDILFSDKKGKIREMKTYDGNVIIASNVGVCSIEVSTGAINWATRTYADSIEVVENMGYVCTSLSFYSINLDTGEMFKYGREDARLPDIEFNGESYWPSGNRVVYHEGLLWYAVYSSGESFVIGIDPHDGHYEWVLHIEKANKIDDLKFHKNRMYLRDIDNNLFVYEK